MDKIKVLCIDDKEKPSVIPTNKWVKEGKWYTINHIFIMKNQDNIKGCELSEFDISMYAPYNCYKLDRFAVDVNDIEKLIEFAVDCGKLNDVNIDVNKITEIVRELETV